MPQRRMPSLIVAAFVLAAGSATAQPVPEDSIGTVKPPRGDWFKSLMVPPGNEAAGESCCDIADGFPARAEQGPDGTWRAQLLDTGIRPLPEGFRNGEWFDIPPQIVLKEASRTQDAYVFIHGHGLRCFVPPLRGF